MKLIKDQDFGFATRKVYDLGKSTAKGWGDNPRKILIVTELETGQGSKERFVGRYYVEYDGNVRIETATKPYNVKIKGYDY